MVPSAEVEAVDEGTVAKLFVAEGTEGVKVNAVIAMLVEEGEDPSSVSDAAPAAAPASNDTPAPAQEAPKAVEPASKPAPAPATAAPAQNKGDRVFASPLARRIAAQNNVDLTTVTGSGPHGRIVKADVENLEGGAAAQTATAARPMATSMSDNQVLALYNEEEYELVPHDGMRRVIAERLTESTQTIPSYFISMDCELDALLALRKDMNAAAPLDENEKPAYKISVNDFIMKAMALALQDVPMANASWTSNARVKHKHSDVGVAVAVDDGLFTPVVRKAEEKSLSQISAEVKDLAYRARNKKLAPQEYQGGSTAVSNLGMFGVSNFTSIINPPHASIMSVGAGEKKAVIKDGEITTATVMTVTFAFDHRVIDGALGAVLAGAFKKYIEKPVTMLV